MPTRRTTRTTARRPRRKLIWARTTHTALINPGGQLVSTPLATFETTYGAQLIGATLMAVRGVVCVTLRGPTVIGGNPAIGRVRMGMRITDHSDLAPVDYALGAMYGNQAHADWFLFEPFCLDNAGTIATATDEVDTTAASEIRQINCRARRRFQELDQTLEMIVGSPAPGAGPPPENTTPISYNADLSILIALP